MRLSLSVKTLFRSPLKTLLSFLLLAAASFMFVYSAADCSLTAREFNRAVSEYHGYLSVEYNTPPRPLIRKSDIDDSRFLLSDPRCYAKSDELYNYDDYHHKNLAQSDIDYMFSSPYVTGASRRYMTAGISSEYFRLDNNEYFYNHSARFVYEATFVGFDNDESLKFFFDEIYGDVRQFLISNVKVLAGNPAWLLLKEENYRAPEPGQHRIQIIFPSFEYLEKYKYIGDFVNFSDMNTLTRFLTAYRFNIADKEQYEGLVPGSRYIFAGRIDPLSTSSLGYRCEIGDDTLYNWWPYIYPLEGLPQNYLELDEFKPLCELIKIINDDLHTFDVVYTDDMESIRRVAEERILITEGRKITPEDSENKNSVCVVSDAFMKEYGLKLGDKVRLRLGNELFEQYAPLGAVASVPGRYADVFTDAEFEIVGVYIDRNIQKIRTADMYWAYSDNTVFVPLSFLPVGEGALEGHEFKPAELSFIVSDPRNIRAFTEECIPKLKETGLTVYFNDSGWLKLEERFKQAKTLSMTKALIFTAASLLALILTVYLFIMRKRREYAVMRALGTTKLRAGTTLFVPLITLAVPAVCFGGIAAIFYAGRTAAASLKAFAEMGLEVDSSVPVSVAVYGIIGGLLLLSLLTVGGLRRIGKKSPLTLLQENTNKNTGGKARPGRHNGLAKAAKSAPEYTAVNVNIPVSLPAPQPLMSKKYGAVRHILRYILKHSRRALAKSLLALMLAALLSGAIGQFTALRRAYAGLYQNITVKPMYINGLTYSRAKMIAESGYVHSPYYEYIDKLGEVNVENSIDFYLSSDLSRITSAPIEFLEGYDASSVMSLKEKICLMPSGLMDKLGVKLGDVVELNHRNYIGILYTYHPEYTEEEVWEAYHQHSVNCRAVGRIKTEAVGDIVIIPITASDFFRSYYDPLRLDLAEYILSDYHRADEFREYSQDIIDSIRIFPPLFIMDTGEADNIYKIYRLIEALYPIAVAAAALIGGLLPGLIIIQAAKEASILRVLGTTKRRTRAMLVSEQLLQCLLGLMLAFTVLIAVNGVSLLKIGAPLGFYFALHFICCAAGTIIGAAVVTRRRILELLQVKE